MSEPLPRSEDRPTQETSPDPLRPAEAALRVRRLSVLSRGLQRFVLGLVIWFYLLQNPTFPGEATLVTHLWILVTFCFLLGNAVQRTRRRFNHQGWFQEKETDSSKNLRALGIYLLTISFVVLHANDPHPPEPYLLPYLQDPSSIFWVSIYCLLEVRRTLRLRLWEAAPTLVAILLGLGIYGIERATETAQSRWSLFLIAAGASSALTGLSLHIKWRAYWREFETRQTTETGSPRPPEP